MSDVAVFIFDEIFESMMDAAGMANLRNMVSELYIISQKSKIAECKPIQNIGTQKILCINPDFVDWDFPSSVYKDIPGLKTIISSSDNISWLDTTYADEHGIRYIALENLTTEYAAVAEYATTIMMSLARNIPLLGRANYPLDYAGDFMKYQGMDIAGKTVGIIGLGNVGSAIAERCTGLGMKVIYWSRNRKPSGYEYCEIDDLLQRADVVSPTLKPNSDTKAMLPNERLAPIKQDAIVVSVVSGLIDNEYLAKRTANKQLFGFGFGADPNTFANYSGNIWAIPDYAWATKNNMQATYDQFVAKISEASHAATH